VLQIIPVFDRKLTVSGTRTSATAAASGTKTSVTGAASGTKTSATGAATGSKASAADKINIASGGSGAILGLVGALIFGLFAI